MPFFDFLAVEDAAYRRMQRSPLVGMDWHRSDWPRWSLVMPTSFPRAVALYLDSRNPSDGTRSEYKTTVRKWCEWNCHVSIEELDRSLIRDFLKWVRARAVEDGGTNPGRTTNKARTQLRAVISWAWENDLIDTPPRFPRPVRQRDVAVATT